MFVRKLQAICILLVLVILVETSTAVLVTTNDTKNSTNIANTTAEIGSSSTAGYPTHQVWAIARGYLNPLNWIHLHWVDWTGNAKWHEEIDPNRVRMMNYTSPSWAAGYYIEAYSPHYGNAWTKTVYWWDGWVDGKFCNDLHFYLKHFIILSL